MNIAETRKGSILNSENAQTKRWRFEKCSGASIWPVERANCLLTWFPTELGWSFHQDPRQEENVPVHTTQLTHPPVLPDVHMTRKSLQRVIFRSTLVIYLSYSSLHQVFQRCSIKTVCPKTDNFIVLILIK